MNEIPIVQEYVQALSDRNIDSRPAIIELHNERQEDE